MREREKYSVCVMKGEKKVTGSERERAREREVPNTHVFVHPGHACDT